MKNNSEPYSDFVDSMSRDFSGLFLEEDIPAEIFVRLLGETFGYHPSQQDVAEAIGTSAVDDLQGRLQSLELDIDLARLNHILRMCVRNFFG